MTIVYGGYRASLKVRRSAQLSKNLPFMDMGPYNPQPTTCRPVDVVPLKDPRSLFVARTRSNAVNTNLSNNLLGDKAGYGQLPPYHFLARSLRALWGRCCGKKNSSSLYFNFSIW